jgi:GAF domain-containing protein
MTLAVAPALLASVANSPSRLAAVEATGLVGAGADEAFDRLSRLASRILGAPVSMITLLAGDRQYFQSQVGVPDEIAAGGAIPISHALCNHTIALGIPLVLDDTHADDGFAHHPAVAELGVRAYLGAPLTTQEGEHLGTICAIDMQPRDWSSDDIRLVTDLAALTMAEIRRTMAERGLEIERREKAEILEQAARTKTAFLTVMGREIRSPITAVMGMAELLLEDIESDDHRGMLEVIRTSGEQVNSALSEMLRVARLEAEDLDVGPTDHVRLTRDVLELLKPAGGR